MKLPLLAALLLTCALSANAQDTGYWRAAGNTASSITGDIGISVAKLTLNFVSFPLAEIRALQPVEINALFNPDAATPNAISGSGNLYRLSIPGAKRFLHKNTLCGSDDVQWMATWTSGRTLEIALFSGSDMPVLKPEVIANTTSICGTFTYSR
ncbi:MAG: hypothetical protein WBF42_13780 [Terracidiphilus sp.]